MLNKFFRNRNLIWIGVAFGAFLYFVESLFHVVILHGGSLTQELIAPDGYELWLRGIIWLICILAGVLLQWASVRLRRATQALRESEERLRSTILSMDDLLFVLDRDGNFLDYHAPQSSMLYVPPERFLGKHYREVMPPPIAERIDKALTRALNNERSQTEYELELNGQTFWFDARLAPRHDSAGRVDSVTVVVKDITIQKQAELVLQTSEKSYRGLFNSVADAIYIQDKDGRFLDVNDGAVKMYGYPREFFIGKTPESLSAPGKNNMEEVVQKVVRAFTTGEPQRFDFWGLRSNGEVFPKDVRVYKGNYFGQEALIVLATDITERKRTEEALRNSEATLRATLESTGDGILVVDGSGRVIQTNDRFSELWRIPQPVLDAWDDQKLLDHILDQLIDPESFLDKVKQLYASSKDDYDVLFFKDNRVYERFSSPLILNDEVAGRVWSFNDITDRVRVEEELQRNKLMIDTANASILWIRRDGTLTDVNGSVCRMLGYSREELLSMSVFDFDQRFDNERWAASWQETKSTAKSHSFSEHTRKDGQIIPVEIISNYLEYNGEEYQCCFVTDISRRKRNETVQSVLYEISEATGRASSLVELLEVIQKEIGRLIDTNNFYVALYDEVSGLYSFPFARDDMSGDPTLIPPQNLKRSLTDYVRRRGEAVLLSQSEIEALARNGEIDLIGELARIWMGIPLLLSGRVIGVVGIQSYTNEAQYSEQDRDLMSIVASSIAMAIERKQSEEDLAAANQMMRNVLDTIPVRVFWKDVNSVYLGCNELYAFDAGCDDSSEVIGKTDADLKWKSEAESFQATDRDIMATGIPRLDYLEPLYYPDGSRGWSQTSKIPLRNTNDQIVGVLGVYQDITDRIRAEEAVRHERDIAQRYLNIAGVLLLALDTKGIVTMINPKGCGILGYEQNELIGSNWFDKCVPFDIRESTRAEFCTLLTGVKGN
ncbi:PAS domain S-box protein, partial [bacterium]